MNNPENVRLKMLSQNFENSSCCGIIITIIEGGKERGP